MQIKITKENMKSFGANSLLALVYEKSGFNSIAGKQVTLLFQQSTEQSIRQNGPEEIIVPEYVPWLLVEDVVSLIKLGCEIHIDSYQE